MFHTDEFLSTFNDTYIAHFVGNYLNYVKKNPENSTQQKNKKTKLLLSIHLKYCTFHEQLASASQAFSSIIEQSTHKKKINNKKK